MFLLLFSLVFHLSLALFYFYFYLLQIFFMDYGNTKRDVPSEKIYHIDSKLRSRNYMFDKLPDLAVECSLAKVQPSLKDEGKWSSAAIKFMKNYCLNRRTIAKVRLLLRIITTLLSILFANIIL